MSIRGVTSPSSYKTASNPFAAQPHSETLLKDEASTCGESTSGEITSQKENEPLSVTEAVALANKNLKKLPITLIGEITSLKDGSGYTALYFTVQDDQSKLECRLWKNRYAKMDVVLKNQLEVQLSGYLDIYGKTGRLSFDVHSVVIAGEGLLRQQVHELAARLRAEGYMDQEKKLPIPKLPEVIGIVTSGQGSVVHDMLRTLRARLPMAKIVFASVPVEGDKAVPAMMKGLRAVYDAGAEVVLIGRGGGSLQDLMPFNDERLAITISRCPIPVVAAVGHETDTTIAEMVSDLRASTPTGAAAAVSPDPGALENHLTQLKHRMDQAMLTKLATLEARTESIATRPLFADPTLLFAREGQNLDYAQERLDRVLPTLLSKNAFTLQTYEKQLRQALPQLLPTRATNVKHLDERLFRATENLIPHEQQTLSLLEKALTSALQDTLKRANTNVTQYVDQLNRAIAHTIDTSEKALLVQAANLEALSPVAVLSRGYAITKNENGNVVSSIHEVTPGELLHIRVSDGTIAATTTSISPAPPERN